MNFWPASLPFIKLPEPWSHSRICLVDVGARGGASRNWLRFSENMSFVFFEPDQAEARRLRTRFTLPKQAMAKVYGSALGSSEKTVFLNVTKYPPASSILTPNSKIINSLEIRDALKVKKVVRISQYPLDKFLPEFPQPPDFLKLDVQGYEMDVLRGGGKTLRQLIGCELEVSFIEIYKNQPLFSEIDSWMRKHGFWLADLERVWWRRRSMPRRLQERGSLAYGNAVYLRNSVLSPKNFKDAVQTVVICLALNLDELAYEVAQQSFLKGWISKENWFGFEAWLHQHRRQTAFWFRMGEVLDKLPGRQTLGRWLGLWSRALQGNRDTGSDADGWSRRTSW